MLHARNGESMRRYRVTPARSRQHLADQLSQYTHVLCAAFEHRGYLFVNDSLGEDSAQEWAVFKGDHQLESITFSWCSTEEAERYIGEITDGIFDGQSLCRCRLHLHEAEACAFCA